MKPLKNLLRKISPGLFNALASVRFFIRCRKHLGPSQALVARTVYGDGPITVLGGPFDGMRYYNKTIWGTITSKWLGNYEQEIQGVVAEIIGGGYDTVVDVGAAEGYYAIGLALRMPDAKVISYDIDPIARYRQKQLAELNGITTLEIRKYCSHDELKKLAPLKPVIICDIEGFEFDLLDPAACPALKGLDILVETHISGGRPVAEVADAIEGRFAPTHDVRRISRQPRDRDEVCRRVPKLRQLTDAQIDFALDEGRYPGQVWLWMKPKSSVAAA